MRQKAKSRRKSGVSLAIDLQVKPVSLIPNDLAVTILHVIGSHIVNCQFARVPACAGACQPSRAIRRGKRPPGRADAL